MSDLIEMREVRDGEAAITVKVPLESSAIFGKYWYLMDTEGLVNDWGTNCSDYNPKFSVTTRRMYHLQVVEGLEGSLATFQMSLGKGDTHYMPIIAPITNNVTDMQNFLHTFDDPLILVIGRQPITPEDVEDEVFEKIKDFYVFDRVNTIWDWKVKSDAIDSIVKKATNIKKGDFHQGNLYWEKGNIQDKDIPESGIKSVRQLIIKDHLIRREKGKVWGVSCDERAVLLSPSYGGEVEISLLSYKYFSSELYLKPGEVLIFKYEPKNEKNKS